MANSACGSSSEPSLASSAEAMSSPCRVSIVPALVFLPR